MADGPAASPPESRGWASYQTWQELFAALSSAHEDSDLATAICGQRGNASAGNIQKKMRQIEDWRAGHALPNRRDLQVMATVLDVGRDANLSDAWTGLYHSAGVIAASGGGGRRPAVPVSDGDAGTLGTKRLISWFWNIAIAGVVLVSLVVLVVSFLQRQ